jgi:putative ABC transport system permease protein
MITLVVALRNLLRKPRRTLVLGGLIAIVMAMLVFADSIFQSTNKGLETSFRKCLTADLVVAQSSGEAFNLFGSDIPIADDYLSIPELASSPELSRFVGQDSGVESIAGVVACVGMVQVGGASIKAQAFGIEPASYSRTLPSLALPAPLPAADSRFIYLGEDQRAQLEKSLGRPLEKGEKISFAAASGSSFRIRSVYYAGSFSYLADSEALKRVALIDAVTARALSGYGLGYKDAAASAAPSPVAEPDSVEDLFSQSATSGRDAVGQGAVGFDPESLGSLLSKSDSSSSLVLDDSSGWNFLLVRAKPGADLDALSKRISSRSSLSSWGARVMDWRSAAGVAAQGILILQVAFGFGIGIIIIGALLILMNALVVSAMERKDEIGSMRAIGASKAFVRSLFALESVILVGAFAFVGCALGLSALLVVADRGIPISNQALASLFGGPSIRPDPSLGLALWHFLAALLAGALAWVYPVRVALRRMPARAASGRAQ